MGGEFVHFKCLFCMANARMIVRESMDMFTHLTLGIYVYTHCCVRLDLMAKAGGWM